MIRDPVNRFISCYNNRILYHQDLAFNNYSIDQVIEKSEWGHSAFTKNLLAGLKDGLADENMDDVITAEELGVKINYNVDEVIEWADAINILRIH